ncbi:MAG: glycosyl hydrolase [Dysgonomonas sp.]
MKKIISVFLTAIISISFATGQQTEWPIVKSEMKPAARWWWLGSAVDKENLKYNIEEYARKGMGGLEITPIYGVKGNEANDIEYLSPKWMKMLDFSEKIAAYVGVKIDMNTGTGWPFGGPDVTIENAATKVIFQEYHLKGGEKLNKPVVVEDKKQKDVAKLYRLMAYSDKGDKIDLTDKVSNGNLEWISPKGNWHLIAVFNGKTRQKVKRAAPGGEGYVMNHFSHKAVADYLGKYTKAFAETGTKYPNTFFNDSYEVYGADWTPDMFEQFEKRRGYKLEDYLQEFVSKEKTDISSRVISDYRETLAELLLKNFTRQWTNWAHSHGSTTRNQAHGSPGNLIDLYATVDIPECETFGISDFHIKGLRKDSIRKENDSDLSMLKYASSAAHITGKPYVSSETLTWLTDHFRTSLFQCKPDLDQLFVSGVNHIFFHGTTYSPKDAEWPGWKFYASIDMSPTNTIWRDAGAMFEYITRCQSFLQEGEPDNDFLLYLPIYDLWHEQNGRLLMFDIHKMQRRAPKFISAVNNILDAGYDVDYISDNFLMSTKVTDGNLITSGNASYKAIIVPGVDKIPLETMAQLLNLAKQGAKVIFMEQYPSDVPGLKDLDNRRNGFRKLVNDLVNKNFDSPKSQSYGKGQIITGTDYDKTLGMCNIRKEEMKTVFDLQYIRRKNDDGYHYFISALHEKDTDAWIPLAVEAESVIIFNPMNGSKGLAETKTKDGKTYVYLQLRSGESVIVKTFNNKVSDIPEWKYYKPQTTEPLNINKGWELSFVESDPEIKGTFDINTLKSWTEIDNPDAKINKGTAVYSTTFNLPDIKADEWELSLGDVCESARVRINGQEVATLWAVPFRTLAGKYLKEGSNKIEIEVTNLPANRIADYDRRKVDWRIFKEINIVKLGYKKGDYSDWETVPSGLLGPVTLTPLTIIK